MTIMSQQQMCIGLATAGVLEDGTSYPTAGYRGEVKSVEEADNEQKVWRIGPLWA